MIMITKEVTVKNRAGLHTRPAAALVKNAAKYKSNFYITKNNMRINGKSIIGVMTLAAAQGTVLTLEFEGEDEEEAARAIVQLFEDGFGEE